jgi:glutamate 5-kinase
MHPLAALESGGACTWFMAHEAPVAVRKQWIAATLKSAGEVVIDAGAAAALGRGKSLLPAGVVEVRGRFDRGDAVRVIGQDGRELARGLTAYSSEDARRICGRKTAEIESLLGYRGRDEIIHRDDLVVARPRPGDSGRTA